MAQESMMHLKVAAIVAGADVRDEQAAIVSTKLSMIIGKAAIT